MTNLSWKTFLKGLTRVSKRRAKIIKRAKEGGLKFVAMNLYQIDIFELQMKSKKKVLGVFIGNIETFTRYSEVADEKKGLRGRLPFLIL